jgi:predicted RND superfamily exporter protein
MWRGIARYILRYRIAFVVILAVITAFMAWQGRKVEMSYEYAPLLPKKDSIFIENHNFIKKFGAGSDIVVIGVKDPDFFKLSHFEQWNKMCSKLDSVEGVEGMLSVASSYNIKKNKKIRKFEFEPIFPENITDQAQLDSLAGILKTLPFYKNQLYNSKNNTFLLAITVDKALMATPGREKMVNDIVDVCESYSADTKIKLYKSNNFTENKT